MADPSPSEDGRQCSSAVSPTFPREAGQSRAWVGIATSAAVVIVVAAAWIGTGLGRWAAPEALEHALSGLRDDRLGPLLMVGIYVAGGLVCFPVLVLIAATAMLYGPLLGFATAMAGVTASAVLLFWVGRWIGPGPLERLGGAAVRHAGRRIAGRGLVTLAVVRTIPLAPFTLVSLVAGATGMRFPDYLAGTVAGMAPGLLTLMVLGNQLVAVVSNPSMDAAAGLLALSATAAVTGWAAARLIRRPRRAAENDEGVA